MTVTVANKYTLMRALGDGKSTYLINLIVKTFAALRNFVVFSAPNKLLSLLFKSEDLVTSVSVNDALHYVPSFL